MKRVRSDLAEGGRARPPRHSVSIFWSDDDGAFIADVPELPGCMAHGDTREEALANAQEAMDFWRASRGSGGARFRSRSGG